LTLFDFADVVAVSHSSEVDQMKQENVAVCDLNVANLFIHDEWLFFHCAVSTY